MMKKLNMNKFVFIVPMRNASSTLSLMLHSVFSQTYQNWKIVLIDDLSDTDEIKKIDPIVECFQKLDILQSNNSTTRLEFYSNEKLKRGRQWETSNVLFGIKKCDDNDIVCRLDADDLLIDCHALSIINSVYSTADIDCLWTAHRWWNNDKITNINISNNLPVNANPYKHAWVSSHLKTFKKYLINNVAYENFLNQNNELVRRCGDQAIYLPILMKSKKYHFLPVTFYAYNCSVEPSTFQTEDAKFQKIEADFIRNRGFINSGKPWEDYF